MEPFKRSRHALAVNKTHRRRGLSTQPTPVQEPCFIGFYFPSRHKFAGKDLHLT
uniref:Uncharacterized protein n=1 Tax=Myoviridae sp. ctbWL16 TaxID=2826668 RepID=A0A8S5MS15_9CAUD|nr:MAG TPA: hypothetical protein [Myoviridae sp. ctbWL16]